MAVQMRTMLAVADNSGARKLQMILPLGGSLGAKAYLGDVITAAVKEASPDGTVKKVETLGGSPILVQAAQDCVYHWKFATATGESQEVIEMHFDPNAHQQ